MNRPTRDREPRASDGQVALRALRDTREEGFDLLALDRFALDQPTRELIEFDPVLLQDLEGFVVRFPEIERPPARFTPRDAHRSRTGARAAPSS